MIELRSQNNHHQHQQQVVQKLQLTDNRQLHQRVIHSCLFSNVTVNFCPRLESTSNRQVFKSSRLLPFTIPEFKYSPLHLRLLNSVFDSIESDVRLWRSFVFSRLKSFRTSISLFDFILVIQQDQSLMLSIIPITRYSALMLYILSLKWLMFYVMRVEVSYLYLLVQLQQL